MRYFFYVFIATAALMATLPVVASAATVSSSGGQVIFTAAPGESNWVTLGTTTECEGLPAPCLKVGESTSVTLVTGGGCITPQFWTFPTAYCPLPTSVSVDVGDYDDRVYDWDEASTISGGPGADIIEGGAGHDVLDGGIGGDVLIGGPGNDHLKGGQGADLFEANLWPQPAFARDSEGSDVIEGGPDGDAVSYRGRMDPLFFTVDDLANDGAAAESDRVGRDVEAIEGGPMGDTMIGDAGHNGLYGGDGPDTIRGGPGDDTLQGGLGSDSVSGDEGADKVFGGGNDDVIDGGPGVDDLYGEGKLGCDNFIEPCTGGSDEIRARDGERDLLDCGDGTDRGVADAIDVMRDIAGVTVCESIERQALPTGPTGQTPANGTTPPALAKALAACAKLPPSRRAACVRLTRAVARCGALTPASRKAACVRKARAVARCQSLKGTAARARCMRAIPKGRRS